MARKTNIGPTAPGPGAIYVDWIKRALADGSITQRALARHLDLSPSAINRIVSGERNLRAHEIPLIAQKIGAPPGISGVQVQDLPTFTTINVAGVITMGQWTSVKNRPAAAPETVMSVEDKFPPSQQLAYRIDRDALDALHRRDPSMGQPTHVFTVGAAMYRPSPIRGDRFVIVDRQGDLQRHHIYFAEQRASGVVLVGLDDTVIETLPPDARWIIASHDVRKYV